MRKLRRGKGGGGQNKSAGEEIHQAGEDVAEGDDVDEVETSSVASPNVETQDENSQEEGKNKHNDLPLDKFLKRKLSKSQRVVFSAEVHAENEDNSESIKSTISPSTDEAITEPIAPFKKLCDTPIPRKSCLSTGRISVSSLSCISPTLSNHTNVAPSPDCSLQGLSLKRVKDIKNKERMMVGSDFSLPGTELEMDYYDYNVQNTNTVPGSFLGMDPAYCLWIPPFAPGQWMDKGDDDTQLNELSEDGSPHVTDNIELHLLDGKQHQQPFSDSESVRSDTPYSEKFQKECRNKEKEQFKRLSCMSTSSSCNRTIVPDDPDELITPEDEEVKRTLMSYESEDIKYADDEEDDVEMGSIASSPQVKRDIIKIINKEYGIKTTAC